MRRMILLLPAAALLLSACGGGTETASPTASGPQTITLLSGEEPLPTYTIENGEYAGETGTVHTSSDIDTCAGGAHIQDTRWVSVSEICERNHASSAQRPDGSWFGGDPIYTHYDVTFELPSGFTSPSISVLVFAADAAEVILNGTSLGAQSHYRHPERWRREVFDRGYNYGAAPSWGIEPSSFTSEKASLFRSGVNILRFRVVDICGVGTQLDYAATITYSP